MICSHCGYEWNYKGSMLFVTCPRCLRKTKTQNDIRTEREEKRVD